MLTVLLTLSIGLVNVLCFFIGARLGQKVVKDEPIIVPNPVLKVKEYKQSKEEEKRQKEIEDMMKAIDNYDGN